MTDFIQEVDAEAQKAIAFVKAGLTYLETEGQTVMAWVEKEVPGSAGAIATFLQGAESDAAELAKIAASGLSAEIATGGDSMQTFILNLIQSTGMAKNASGSLSGIDVSAVSLIKTILDGLVSTGLAKVLAGLAAGGAAAAAA